MLAIYALTLCVSAGLTGVFVRHVAGALGFVAGFDGGILLAGGVACAYAAAQLLFMCALRFFQPTTSRGPFLTETLSHMSALVLVPFLLDINVSWPHPSMARIEEFVYLGVFFAGHLFFKLATCYASLRGPLRGGMHFVGWLVAACFMGVGAYVTLSQWVQVTEASRQQAEGVTALYRVGREHALAFPLAQGVDYETDIAPRDGLELTFRLANDPDASADAVLDQIYVQVELIGDTTKRFETTVALQNSRWSPVTVRASFIPKGIHACRLHWTSAPAPSWQGFLPFRPVVYLGKTDDGGERAPVPPVLVSGPFRHQVRDSAQGFNVVLISIDGLGSGHLGLFGNERAATPALDKMGASGLSFANAFTPAPDPAAAYMSMLTGLSPIEHGVWSTGRTAAADSGTSVAEKLRAAGYITVAYTEGEGVEAHDLVPRAGFQSGFEVFDPSYTPLRISEQIEEDADMFEGGSRVTLQKLRRWITRNQGRSFFAFARLRELTDPNTFEVRDSKETEGMSPADQYFSALSRLDQELGSLIRFIRDQNTRTNTVIIVTSPYAQNPGEKLAATLSERVLHVPILAYIPKRPRRARPGLVSLQDIAPSILDLARVPYDERAISGRSFLDGAAGGSPIAVGGRPLVVSVRTKEWRYTWDSGRDPQSGEVLSQPKRIGLYRADDSPEWWRHNIQRSNARAAQNLEKQLTRFLDEGFPGAAGSD